MISWPHCASSSISPLCLSTGTTQKVHLHIFVPYRNSLNIPSFWRAFLQVPELFACSQQQLRGLVDFQKKRRILSHFFWFRGSIGIFYTCFSSFHPLFTAWSMMFFRQKTGFSTQTGSRASPGQRARRHRKNVPGSKHLGDLPIRDGHITINSDYSALDSTYKESLMMVEWAYPLHNLWAAYISILIYLDIWW